MAPAAVLHAVPPYDLEANENTPLLGRSPPSPPPRTSWLCKGHTIVLCILGMILFGGIAIGSHLLIIEDQPWVITTSFDLVNRQGWGAVEPPRRLFQSARQPEVPKYIIISHTGGLACEDRATCQNVIRQLQVHSLNKTSKDIPYNFVIGGDGKTYEGRGWLEEDGLVHNLKNISLSIALLGNFTLNHAPIAQLEEAKALIIESIRRRKLHPQYHLIGESQINGSTSSPGDTLMGEIQRWRHWKPCFKNC